MIHMVARTALAATAILLIAITPSISLADDPGPALVSPVSLTQWSQGQLIGLGEYVNQSRLDLQFQITGNGSPLVPQVEWRRASQAFIGTPTHVGVAVTLASGATQTVRLTVSGLRDGVSYNWQVRTLDSAGGPSPWVSFGGSAMAPAVTADLTPPARPVISSTTNPRPGGWYNTRVERFNWKSQDATSGVAGYSYRIDHGAGSRPGNVAPTTSLVVRKLVDGRWKLHVWARDRAGNWSAAAAHAFNLDTTPPRITPISNRQPTFNPYVEMFRWRFAVGERSHVVIDIRRSGQKTPVLMKDLAMSASGPREFVWNGRTSSGKLTAAGWHWFHVTATDALGNSSNLAFGGATVRPMAPVVKRIVISLSTQSLVAYTGNRVVLTSLVSTGNRMLAPTPAGHYRIFAKYSPLQFISPWPPGSPLWYAPAWSTYGMEFISGGYFIHDAPWRSVYGPASQAGGPPGTDYGGTHGCVNVPFSAAQFLYSWAPIGTTIDVVW